jgi:hypothetical protein
MRPCALICSSGAAILHFEEKPEGKLLLTAFFFVFSKKDIFQTYSTLGYFSKEKSDPKKNFCIPLKSLSSLKSCFIYRKNRKTLGYGSARYC